MLKKFNLAVKIFFLILVVLSGSFLAGLPKAKAADSDVVINEVMYSPQCSSTESDCEWLELYNKGDDDVPLENWTLNDNSTSFNILPNFNLLSHNFVVILANDYNGDFEKNYSNFSGDLIVLNHRIGNALSNSGDRLVLKNKDGREIDKVSWGNDNSAFKDASKLITPKDSSIERKPAGFDNDLASDFIIQDQPTPGSGIPPSVFLQNPQITNNSMLLLWSKADYNDFLNYSIYISQDSNRLGNEFDEISDIGNNFYRIDVLQPGIKYYFTIRNYNLAGNYSDSNQVSAIIPIVYSKDIIINEIFPHPSNGTDNEFIELYNSGNDEVDLSGWILSDGVTNFSIPEGTKIKSLGYLIFYKNTIEPKTGISLNDDGDTIKLLYPNGEIASSISYGNASLDISYARGPDNKWSWTTKFTPGAINEIVLPTDEEEDDSDVPINSDPIEISTGDTQNYLDYLVQITGEVIETSGDTFYIDDGSGVIKIYIQSKTGIKKPTMRTGDVFQIIGIVDFYRGVWRILPQTADDIKLIKATLTTKQAKAKQTAKKTATKIISAVKPKSVLGEAKAAGNNSEQSSKTKESNFLQFIELITSLAFIFLVVLIIRLRRVKKPKVIGGDFGDDFT